MTCSTALRALDNYLVEHGIDDKALTHTVVDGWVADSFSDLNINMVRNYINNYIQFTKYLHTLGIAAFVPIPPVYKQGYVPYIFSQQQIDAIFQAADNLRISANVHNSNAAVQFPMVLRILYCCGLRVGEALSLRHQDVDIETGMLRIRNGKGNKERLVPMDESLTDVLEGYCRFVRTSKPHGSFLFEGSTGEPHENSWARNWFRRILEDAGIELLDAEAGVRSQTRNICLNCLRHTFAVTSLRKQVAEGIDNYRSTPLLSIYLGHKKLTGTMKYLHMTAEIAEDIFVATTEYTKGLFPEVPV